MKPFNTPTLPTVATLTAATIGLGIGWVIIGPTPDPRTTPPTPSAHATLQEDDPGWDCATMGNRICADPAHVHATEAWEAWDKVGGWRFLQADPDVENRVDYIGTATLPPNVDRSRGYGAIPAGTGWYVFRAVPVDLATATTSAIVGK
jgi:hypothetical protein